MVTSVTDLHEVAATPSSITLAWTAPASFTESSDGTLLEVGVGSTITDSVGDVYGLTASHQITINGSIDRRTGSSTVDVLFYHAHVVWQQNSKGSWYYTTSATDVWHQASGPIVTHFGVIAELLNLKSKLSGSNVTLVNKIISDVGQLMP
jgi:hypothetical protein